jgi:hypothetical protein
VDDGVHADHSFGKPNPGDEVALDGVVVTFGIAAEDSSSVP